MHLTCTQPPALEPVTLDEAKLQCRIRHSHADDRLNRAIRSARQSAEARTGRALITQRWEQVEDCAPRRIKLGRWPLIEVLSVRVNGDEWPSSQWQVRPGDNPCLISLSTDWTGKEVSIEFSAGYGNTPSDVPEPIRDWMLLQITTLYEHTSTLALGVSVTPLTFADRLLDDYLIPR